MSSGFSSRIISTSGRKVMNRRVLGRGLAAAASVRTVEPPRTLVTTLPNGMRVATENNRLPTSTIGIFIDAGSRYENERNNGTAHFLEHMAFKGTSRRTRHSLEVEVENIGAHLNAYTSREQTVYHARCVSRDAEQSVDILSDILLNSRLNERDVQAERAVILREAEEVAQDYQETIFDELHLAAFDGSPLSYTILGPEKNIKSITRNDLAEYVKTHYTADRMVLAVSGGVAHDEMVKLADRYFGHLPSSGGDNNIVRPEYKPCQKKVVRADMDRVAGVMCVEGVTWSEYDMLVMMVANTILGEWDRSRGLGLSVPTHLQQQAMLIDGLVSYQAFNTCYKDTGLLGTYFVARPEAVSDFLKAIVNSWRWMANDVDEWWLEKGKRSLFTNLVLMLDGNTPIFEDIGRQMLFYNRRVPESELKKRIDAIDVETLRAVCKKKFLQGRLATTYIGNLSVIPDNEELEEALRK